MEKLFGCFSEFQLALNRDYGVPYGRSAEEFETSDLQIEEPWVICPNCEEPIYMSDCIGDGKDYWDCPACCCVEDGVIE